MKTKEILQLDHFKAAKEIALTIGAGLIRRAIHNGETTNYSGANIEGRTFVVGDTLKDIQNPDAWIEGKPAREVFGEFTVMSK